MSGKKKDPLDQSIILTISNEIALALKEFAQNVPFLRGFVAPFVKSFSTQEDPTGPGEKQAQLEHQAQPHQQKAQSTTKKMQTGTTLGQDHYAETFDDNAAT
jgi:hypothetical protein